MIADDSATNGFTATTTTSPPAGTCCRLALRWFSSVREVKLCGHATLAAAHTLFNSGLIDSNIVEFCTLSGILTDKKVLHHSKAANGSATSNSDSYLIELNFPADRPIYGIQLCRCFVSFQSLGWCYCNPYKEDNHHG